MSTNRVLQFLRPRCRHCDAQAQRDALIARAEAIELLAGDVLEFHVPGLESFSSAADPDDDDDEELGAFRFWLVSKPRKATLTEDLSRYASEELRRIGNELLAAADAVEIGGAR